jgi:hypothetical protein
MSIGGGGGGDTDHSEQHHNNSVVDADADSLSLLKCIVSCVHFYCTKLKKRVTYIKDPSTFCHKGKLAH